MSKSKKTHETPKKVEVQAAPVATTTETPKKKSERKVIKGVGDPLSWEPKEIHSVAEFIRAGFIAKVPKKDLRVAIKTRFPTYKPVDRAIFKYYHDLLDKDLIQAQ